MPGLIEFEFLKKMAQLQEQAFMDRNSLVITELSKLFALLKSVSIKPATPAGKIQEILEKKIKNEPLDYDEGILLSIQKNIGGSLENVPLKFNTVEDFNGFYFIASKNGKNIENNYGVLCKGSDFDGTDFYKNVTETNLQFSLPSELRKCAIPSNSAIVIDPYLFKGRGKVENLIEVFKALTPNCGINYQLTIITSTLKQIYKKDLQKMIWQREVQPFNIINGVEKLSNAGFDTQVFVVNQDSLFINRYGRKRDRKILTNYTTISIGHPFEKDETYFSQQFLGGYNDVERIKANYDNFRKEIRMWKNVVFDLPNEKDFGEFKNEQLIFKSKNDEQFINRIFEFNE